jgi:membrane associated rhomboid family serine protease
MHKVLLSRRGDINMKFNFYALKLTAILFIIFFIQLFSKGFTENLLLNSSAFLEPWRFVTAIFLHADLPHILLNSFALALFGSILESLIGGKRFLVIFFLSGIAANLIAVFFYPSSLGASGAIYGIIGSLAVIRPLMVVWAFGMPMPMFVAGLLWAVNDLIGIFVPSNVGNIAHLSGLVVGLILGFGYRKYSYKLHPPKDKINLDERYVQQWEDSFLK